MWCRSTTNVLPILCIHFRACVNHFFHDCVYQDGVWSRAFFQEEPDELAPVLQNESLRAMYNLVNPSPYCGPSNKVKSVNSIEEEIVEGQGAEGESAGSAGSAGSADPAEPAEPAQLVQFAEPTDTSAHQDELLPKPGNQPAFGALDKEKNSKESDNLLKDLSLLYKITEKQGWYKNKKDQCYFIRFKDLSKKSMDILFPAISSSELDSLIRQV